MGSVNPSPAPRLNEPQTTLQNKENIESKHQEEPWEHVCAF